MLAVSPAQNKTKPHSESPAQRACTVACTASLRAFFFYRHTGKLPNILRPTDGSLRRPTTWTRSTSSALPSTMASRARSDWCLPRPQPYVSHSTSMGRQSHREHTHPPPTTITHASSPLYSLITFPSPTLAAPSVRAAHQH